MAGRDWVRAIGEKLRDDLGDCPTLPEELLELLSKLNTAHGDRGTSRVSLALQITDTGRRPHEFRTAKPRIY
jgi:hypothetical protein